MCFSQQETLFQFLDIGVSSEIPTRQTRFREAAVQPARIHQTNWHYGDATSCGREGRHQDAQVEDARESPTKDG